MLLIIKTLRNSTLWEVINIYVTNDTTISQIKTIICKRCRIESENLLKLIFAGKNLADDKKVSDYGLQKETCLFAIIHCKPLSLRELCIKYIKDNRDNLQVNIDELPEDLIDELK